MASLETEMNKDLANVCKWYIANKLSLNPSKSNHLIITPKQDIRSPHFTLFINSLPILSCDNAKYLGVLIDSHLNFNCLIKSVENKVVKSVGNGHSFKIETFSSFYFSSSIILCFYSSSFVVWFIHLGFYPQILSKLQTLQNKAVKTIGGGKYLDHATPFYSKLKILKIPKLYKHEVAKLVYFTINVNVSQLYCQTFSLKLTKFLKSLHVYQALPIILPHTFLFTKQTTNMEQNSNKH